MIGLPSGLGLVAPASLGGSGPSPTPYGGTLLVDMPLNGDLADRAGNVWIVDSPELGEFVPSAYPGLQFLRLKSYNEPVSGITEKVFARASVIASDESSFCIEFFASQLTPSSNKALLLTFIDYDPEATIGISYLDPRLQVTSISPPSAQTEVRLTVQTAPGNFVSAVRDSYFSSGMIHIAITKDGDEWVLYLNGVEADRKTLSSAVALIPNILTLGHVLIFSTDSIVSDIEISHLRIITGHPVYTENFIPPSLPNPY